MKQIYYIEGMSCKGCSSHVEKTLSQVAGVSRVSVDLDRATASIEMEDKLSFEVLQDAMQADGTTYAIHTTVEKRDNSKKNKESQKKTASNQGMGTFYCPMHCEGDKTYQSMVGCPVCGMDLVEEQSLSLLSSEQWTCSMHPEVIQDFKGPCPICSIDLIPITPAISKEEKSDNTLIHKFWIAVIFTTPIFLIAMSESITNNPLYEMMSQTAWNWVQCILSIPVLFYATSTFFQRAYTSIKTRNLNMFTLIGIGAGVAWGFSLFGLLFPGLFPSQFTTASGNVFAYFEAATVILTLALLGQLLEARAHGKTNSAVKELLQLAPNRATRIVDGEEEEVGITNIRVGDILKVKPGEKIPVDGVIENGETHVDESMITGEPIPVNKSSGDAISSGTVNGNQAFLMKAEKVGNDTLLARIVQMVNEASRSRAPIQKLADRISTFFVPIVMLISVVTFVIWSLFGPNPAYVYALVNAIAVLIIACPCALGLATPMSIMVSIGKGAKSGVLIKNAEALEKMDSVNTLVIDKTGTITEGTPSLQEVCSLHSKWKEHAIVQYAVSLNSNSEHPLGEAIVRYGKEHGVKLLPVTSFQSIPGKGVEAHVKHKHVALGNQALLQHFGVAISLQAQQQAQVYQKQGKTISFLVVDGLLCGFVVIFDSIKHSSAQAIHQLQEQGVDVVMLTGDNQDTAHFVAQQLHLTQFKAGMLPGDKLKEVTKLQNAGKIVAVAGDGINDAPALAKSDVGIAMGTGTDVAIESAMITLVHGDLQGIVKAKNLSHATMKNIQENLFFAFVYNSLGVPLAAGLLFPFTGILLSPMIAALAMSFSSVSVITNALRLRRAKI